MDSNELTKDEETVLALAKEQMREEGKSFKPIFIVGHGFEQDIIYLVFGYSMDAKLGLSDDSQILLFLRMQNGFVYVPDKEPKRVESPEEEALSLVDIIKRLRRFYREEMT